MSVLLALGGCGGDTTAKPASDRDGGAVTTLCQTICTRSRAAKCAGDESDCETECASLIGESPTACRSALNAFTACASTARFTCDAEGESEALACDAQLTAWARCSSASTQMNDAGSSIDGGGNDAATSTDARALDASLLECPLEDDETVCSTCIKFSCCEEVTRCGVACKALVECASACPSMATDDACARACFTAHPDGISDFTNFAGCLGEQCDEACGSDAG